MDRELVEVLDLLKLACQERREDCDAAWSAGRAMKRASESRFEERWAQIWDRRRSDPKISTFIDAEFGLDFRHLRSPDALVAGIAVTNVRGQIQRLLDEDSLSENPDVVQISHLLEPYTDVQISMALKLRHRERDKAKRRRERAAREDRELQAIQDQHDERDRYLRSSESSVPWPRRERAGDDGLYKSGTSSTDKAVFDALERWQGQ